MPVALDQIKLDGLKLDQIKLDEILDELARRVDAEGRLDDLSKRIRSSGSLRDFVARLERELPDTDRDRYDRAFARGFARARSGYLFAGLALGAIGGAAAIALLDPQLGRSRRIGLGEKLAKWRKDVSQTAGGRGKWLSDRARGMAIERGVIRPEPSASARDWQAVGPGATETWPVPATAPAAEAPTAAAAEPAEERVPVAPAGRD